MSGELEKKYLCGEVVNTISNIYLVETDSAEFPSIDLVRNSLTIELNPLLEEISMLAKVKMEVVEGPYGKIFLIQEMTKSSARAAYERIYADLIAKGQVTIPENLSAVVPQTLTLEQYKKDKAAKARQDKDLGSSAAPVQRSEAHVTPIAEVAGTNGSGNGKAANGSNGTIDLHRLPADGAPIIAGD